MEELKIGFFVRFKVGPSKLYGQAIGRYENLHGSILWRISYFSVNNVRIEEWYHEAEIEVVDPDDVDRSKL